MKKLIFLVLVLGFVSGLLAQATVESLRDEKKLIDIIKNPTTSDNDMVTACQDLGLYGGAPAVPVLAGLLNHDKAHLRNAARYGIEMIGDDTAIEALCSAAKELEGPALIGVLQSLGNLQSDQAIEVLRSRLTGNQPEISMTAAQSLGKIATPVALDALKDHVASSPIIAAAYFQGITCLSTKNPSIVIMPYYQHLRKLKDAIPASIYQGGLLGEIVHSGKPGLALWKESIASTDEVTLRTALRAVLEKPVDQKATLTFAKALAKYPAIQIRLVNVLGIRGDLAAVPAIAKLANDAATGEDIRLAAASALAAMNSPTAIKPLMKLSLSQDEAVATAAKNTMMGFAGEAADTEVLKMMENSDASLRMAGIEMAQRRRMSIAVPSMVKLIKDKEQRIAEAAIKGVGELGTATEIPALLQVIAENPEQELAVRALSSLCSRYARPQGGNIKITRALFGNFENNLFRDVTDNVQKLVDAGSITIQASGRLCRSDGFSQDPAPGKVKTLRMEYTFDGVEKNIAVLENNSCHLSGVTLLPVAMEPIAAAYQKAQGKEKTAIFEVFVSLGNAQALEIVRSAAQQKDDLALQEAAMRALINWQTPDALKDVALLAENAPTDRLKILALRGFVRQLEMAFTIPMSEKLQRLEVADKWALRPEDKAYVAAALQIVRTQIREEGFKPMFDGKSLANWKGGDGWWEAKDGILQAQSSEGKLCKKNAHLIWKGGEPADFEMRAEFKLSPNANSGIQIRAKDQVFGDSGYQADMNGNGAYVGFLYHPAQHLVGERGAKVVINAQGEKSVERFADAKELGDRVFKKDDWNEYHIICKGPAITLYVNEVKTCEFEDHRPDTPRKGTITLQMHQGAPMKIQFRNLRIKKL